MGYRTELNAWHATGLRIAVWWSGGESAAFLQECGWDAHRFSIVVDSDAVEVGRSVAGTGQMIRGLEWLRANPVDIILVPCARHAAEVIHELDAVRIPYEGILIPQEGRLMDFHASEMMLA